VSDRGFFHHFLDLHNANRAWKSEFSTIDTTILIIGALTAAAYFEGSDAEEPSIRHLAARLYEAADWDFALAGGLTVAHGWKPEFGFLRYRWEGYNEGLLLYALATGSPTHAISPASYEAATRTYRWRKIYGLEFVYAGPLFIHQLSHLWIDFRGIRDRFMESKGIDYFVNSQRATLIQQQYSIRNPSRFEGYGVNVWGISASDGPGPSVHTISGRRRRFWDYQARGVPWGPDDGTLAPWAVVASLPFEPALVVRTLEEIDRQHPEMRSEFGYKCSFNPTYPGDGNRSGWVSSGYYGIEQGPVVLMIENFRSGLIWRLMQRSRPLVDGLGRMGFRGAWLDENRLR
ncbi:MAG: glucoamylase family protein, partial [bacterium]